MRVMTSAGFDAKSTRKSGLKFCFDSTVLLNAMLRMTLTVLLVSLYQCLL